MLQGTTVVVVEIKRSGGQFTLRRLQDGKEAASEPISLERAADIVGYYPEVDAPDLGTRPCNWTWEAKVDA